MKRVFTPKERRTYEELCRLRQNGILHLMKQFLSQKGYKEIYTSPAFIVAYGDIPVGLVAHADTVFKSPPQDFYYDTDKNVFWSPDGMGADDRAGIYAIMKIVQAGYRPHVIITTDEETGCIGAAKLARSLTEFPSDLKFLIQLDRRGEKDSVFYECGNDEFEDYVNQFGFETEWGSFTDICVLAPAWGVAAVNFSIGYMNEHTAFEILHVDWMFNTINKVCNLLQHVIVPENDVPVFAYVERPYAYCYHGYTRGYNYKTGWDSDWDDYDDILFDHKNSAARSAQTFLMDKTTPEDSQRVCEIDECRCITCGKIDKIVEMIPLTFASGTDYTVCQDCYSKMVDQVFWCRECGVAWYFPKGKEPKISNKNRPNWTCSACAYENALAAKDENRKAVLSLSPKQEDTVRVDV